MRRLGKALPAPTYCRSVEVWVGIRFMETRQAERPASFVCEGKLEAWEASGGCDARSAKESAGMGRMARLRPPRMACAA